MRGRTVFHAVKPLLMAAIGAMRLCPRPVCSLLLVLCRYVPTKVGMAARYVLVARLARSCGGNVAISEGVHFFRLEGLSVGNNVSIHPMCYIDCTGGLRIGSDVSIAHAVTIMTTNHDYGRAGVMIRDAECVRSEVCIADDVWIGAGARILAGHSIGTHVVVGAGAVVTSDIPSGSVAAGVPARVIKKISKERSYETARSF